MLARATEHLFFCLAARSGSQVEYESRRVRGVLSHGGLAEAFRSACTCIGTGARVGRQLEQSLDPVLPEGPLEKPERLVHGVELGGRAHDDAYDVARHRRV